MYKLSYQMILDVCTCMYFLFNYFQSFIAYQNILFEKKHREFIEFYNSIRFFVACMSLSYSEICGEKLQFKQYNFHNSTIWKEMALLNKISMNKIWAHSLNEAHHWQILSLWILDYSSTLFIIFKTIEFFYLEAKYQWNSKEFSMARKNSTFYIPKL